MANLAFQIPDRFREFNPGRLQEAIERAVEQNRTDEIREHFLQCKY